MKCHECARDGRDEFAVAQCRFCLVGLCKRHLVESFKGTTYPQYGCTHNPQQPFAVRAA